MMNAGKPPKEDKKAPKEDKKAPKEDKKAPKEDKKAHEEDEDAPKSPDLDEDNEEKSDDKKETSPSPKDPKEILKKADEYINLLLGKEEYDNAETLAALKGLSKLYWKKIGKTRREIGGKYVSTNLTDTLMKMLAYFNNIGVFKNDDVWFPTYYTMNLIWNYSDGATVFAKDLMAKGMVEVAGMNIGHQPYLDNQGSKNVLYMLKSSLSILQNLCRAMDTPEEREAFERADIKQKLKDNFMMSDNDFLRTLATMVLTAIISEEENKMLEDTGAIPFMVRTLQKAIASPKRRERGFAPVELVECMSRMVINDVNKKKLVEAGGLTPLVKMLQYKNPEEQAIAATTVWNLSFDKDIRELVKAEPDLLPALEKLKESELKTVSRPAKGALWTINEGQHEVTEGEGKSHIFISYAWANQNMAQQINEQLRAEGFRTWIDLEQMGGSTLEAMANAVENAAVVLICASEKYKTSPNCRTEAEYTFQLKKDILPLMMQRRYKPDGWLGMLLGAKFYVNFDGKYEFEHAFSMLRKELAGRGKEDVMDGEAIVPVSAPLTASVPHTKPEYSKWTKNQVTEFFTKEGLTSTLRHFQGYDGRMLSSLRKLRREAPDFFYNHLQDKMNLTLPEILKLAGSLDNL